MDEERVDKDQMTSKQIEILFYNHYNMAVKCFWWSMEEKGKGNERAQPEDAPFRLFCSLIHPEPGGC